ncbi:golgin subfamily A member 2 [Zeugodacus cucurbitae]|uniref:Golgin subfamily A member 2 n=1 Tax=Zeugodacus cucurbitae TaxID=28588 RepID=A0A0A1WSG1_ZEUCU|nr:golgin subfamily A member 2 [Zeugodacus cucurbitae]
MPGEDPNDSKAQKLAAARKKLREYQKRGAADNASQTGANSAPTESHSSSIAGGSSISSNISEASDYDVSSNGHEATSTNVPVTNDNNIATDNATTTEIPVITSSDVIANTVSTVSAPAPPTAASYFQTTPLDVAAPALDSFTAPTVATTVLKETTTDQIQLQQVNAIQVLIAEKAALTTELNKYRCLCRERELETEELRTQLESTTQRQEELTQRHQVQQQNLEQMRNTNAELQHKLAQAHAKQEDQAGHLDELKRLLDVMQQRATDVEHQFKEKANELEMAQLRIRQLSDEASVNQPDNRVETLTQTQFMYEQQIRDLQAMVQQLTYDKEQANNQYQSYVKHLNAELSSLSEKNSELLDECTKQQERERQLVDHISTLEKDIQKNISRQDQLRKEQEQVNSPQSETPVKEVAQLKEQISDFELERHEFQLKIKSQEDRLELLGNELQEKQTKLAQLEEHMRNYAAEQPDQTKLLATMESDKIAASRALAQNIELKKQLDELELRFVQLTNDKADLMNKLDAEEHANREMRANYNEMAERLRSIDERFKYKDEEMIRLSHENMELTNKAAALQRKLKHHGRKLDEHDHEHEHGEHAHEHKQNGCGDGHEHSHEHEHIEHEHEHGNHEHEHGHHDHEHEHDQYDHEHDHAHHEHVHDHSDQEQYNEHEHEHGDHQHEHDHSQHHKHMKQLSTSSSNTSTPYLPTEEAVERLEQRFTRLMSQVADLTDEKQRLEHLVLQLQGETETIGEYITLYQTQRRMLKQREYEKAAQMQLLQHEREQLRDRIAVLNNLVNSLRADMPHSITQLQENYHAAAAPDSAVTNDTSVAADASTPLITEASEAFEEQQQHNHTDTQLTAQESRQILTKIQDIISEINENTQHIPDVATAQTVDHINCCLGKIEVV